MLVVHKQSVKSEFFVLVVHLQRIKSYTLKLHKTGKGFIKGVDSMFCC
jgi:hypothetical protein